MDSGLTLAQKLADLAARWPQVEAVALGGSRAAGVAGPDADIDVYVYTRAEVTPAERAELVLAAGGAARASLNMSYWGPADEWIDAATGIAVDWMFFEADWMEARVRHALDEHQPSLGYSTCFWFTVAHSLPLFDRSGWFADLRARAGQPYPEELRRNIVNYNHPVLRSVITSYAEQIEKAVQRGDAVSANHRVAALLASYFDVLFALNRQPHPGEKRLMDYALRCPIQPEGLAEDVPAVLRACAGPDPDLMDAVNRLLDRLDALLLEQGFDVDAARPVPVCVFPARARALQAYQAPYADPIRAAAGDRVTLDPERTSGWPGWAWCVNAAGKSGWVPLEYLECDGNAATLRRDYDAMELSLAVGDELTLRAGVDGFFWAVTPAGKWGWVPAARVEVIG